MKVTDHPMYLTQPSQGKESSQVSAGSRDGDFDPDSIDLDSLDLLDDGIGDQEVEEEVPSRSLEALDLAYVADVDDAMRNTEAMRKGRPPKPITDPSLCSKTRQRKMARE